MKVPAARVDSFLRQPDKQVGFVLIYGPDAGLVRERAETLAAKVVDDPADPFRLVRLTGTDIADQPARLGDEARSIPLGGGRKVVRVDLAGPSKSALAPLTAYAADPSPDALVIVEAGDLGPRDALRVLFERAPGAAALACYLDDERSLPRVIREALAADGVRVSRDAMAFLASHLGGDRLATRRELEKLALYAAADGSGSGQEIGLADAVACVGDSAALTLDDLAFATSGGDQANLDKTFARLDREGVNPVAILRAVTRHFQRLHLVAGKVDGGAPLEASVKALRPRVFWKHVGRFQAQVRLWTGDELRAALRCLTDAEISCKRTGAPARTLCSRALHDIAIRAAAAKPQA